MHCAVNTEDQGSNPWMGASEIKHIGFAPDCPSGGDGFDSRNFRQFSNRHGVQGDPATGFANFPHETPVGSNFPSRPEAASMTAVIRNNPRAGRGTNFPDEAARKDGWSL